MLPGGILSVLAIGALALGCTNRIGDLTFVSTRNIDLSHVSLDVRSGKRVEGADCKYALLGIIPFGTPTLEGAVDDALQKGGGNVMIDQVTYQSLYYFILVSQSCIKAEGTVLSTTSVGPR
jgi:hypothetical protein